MNLPTFIAQRYLLAKKSHNLINIVTWISIVCISVASFAMIFVMSVFNGFNIVISDMIHQLSPDINISSVKGKTLDLNDIAIDKIKNIKGVEFVFPTITEEVLFKNSDKQQIGQVKGVPDDYNKISRIRGTILNDSTFTISNNNINYGIPGAGMAYFLGINVYQPYSTIQVFVPKRGNASTFNLENSFNSSKLLVTKVFSSQQEIDESLVIAPYEWLSNLTGYDNLATDIEIFINDSRQLNHIKKEIKNIVGENYKVYDQYEQQETLYKMMKTEKLAVYLILTFILIMATFNVIGSLSMLIIDKKKDISLLKAMGADNNLVRKIFFNEGLLISVVGGLLGLFIGIIAVLIQEHFGIIKLGNGGNYIIDAYPVALELSDVALIFTTITIIGCLAAFLTANSSIKRVTDHSTSMSTSQIR